MYRQSRSSPVRSCPSIRTLACSEKPSRSQHSSAFSGPRPIPLGGAAVWVAIQRPRNRQPETYRHHLSWGHGYMCCPDGYGGWSHAARPSSPSPWAWPQPTNRRLPPPDQPRSHAVPRHTPMVCPDKYVDARSAPWESVVPPIGAARHKLTPTSKCQVLSEGLARDQSKVLAAVQSAKTRQSGARE
jgi:hypothetical protein